MLAIKIKDIKGFMTKLLSTDTFDTFLLEEARIHTFNIFTIDGHRNRDFYTKEEWDALEAGTDGYAEWKEVKAICFQLIKGKKVPAFMKIVLHYSVEKSRALLEKGKAGEYKDVLKAFVVSIKYDANGLFLTTGTSFSGFVMDRTPEQLWDHALQRFLSENKIEFEEM